MATKAIHKPTNATLSPVWTGLVTYAYLPAALFLTLLLLGYAPDFHDGGHSEEDFLWYVGCVTPGLAVMAAWTLAHFRLPKRHGISTILLISWFPYTLACAYWYLRISRG